jgi:hypothetical protein
LLAAKELRGALPTHIWGTSRWARELFFKTERARIWFRISKQIWLLSFLMSFFNSKKIDFLRLFFSLITCGEAKQFSVFAITLSWRAYQPWSSFHFSYDVLGKKILKKLAQKLGFLMLSKFTSSEYQKSGPPNGQKPPSFQFYLMHKI